MLSSRHGVGITDLTAATVCPYDQASLTTAVYGVDDVQTPFLTKELLRADSGGGGRENHSFIEDVASGQFPMLQQIAYTLTHIGSTNQTQQVNKKGLKFGGDVGRSKRGVGRKNGGMYDPISLYTHMTS